MKKLIVFISLLILNTELLANEIFKSGQQSVQMTITAPFTQLFNKKSTDPEKTKESLTAFISGRLELINPNTQKIENYDIELRLRGNYSLDVCDFPKLKVSFKKDQITEGKFFNKTKYDLATHCKNSPTQESDRVRMKILSSSPHREKFLFDLQSELGFIVPSTQNAVITYLDSSTSPYMIFSNKNAFLIENQSDTIKRVNGLYQIIGVNDSSKKDIRNQLLEKVDKNPARKVFLSVQENHEIDKIEVIKLHIFSLLIYNNDFYIKIDTNDGPNGIGKLGMHNIKCIATTERKWRIYGNDLNFSFLLTNTDQTNENMRYVLNELDTELAQTTIEAAQKIGTPEDYKSVINFYQSKKSDLYKMADSISHDQMFMKNYLMYLDIFYKKLDSLNK